MRKSLITNPQKPPNGDILFLKISWSDQVALKMVQVILVLFEKDQFFLFKGTVVSNGNRNMRGTEVFAAQCLPHLS